MNRPITAQLNINSIKNKFQFLEKEVCANLDILLILESKLDDSFPPTQFLLDGFSKPYRLDRYSNGGGIFLFSRDDIPSHLLLNSNKIESIFAENNFRKKEMVNLCVLQSP